VSPGAAAHGFSVSSNGFPPFRHCNFARLSTCIGAMVSVGGRRRWLNLLGWDKGHFVGERPRRSGRSASDTRQKTRRTITGPVSINVCSASTRRVNSSPANLQSTFGYRSFVGISRENTGNRLRTAPRQRLTIPVIFVRLSMQIASQIPIQTRAH